jgi:large subunit ribosomal protein L15
MKLNELRDIDDASKSRKRVGRGIGSSKGKTSGRGVKGQKSRSGVAINGFEGGQMPIYMRLPKRGFSNAQFAVKINIVSIGRIEEAIAAKKLDPKVIITAQILVDAGVLRRAKDGVRLLSDGDAKSKLVFEVAGASKAAIEKVEKAGGKVNILTPAVVEAPKEN